MRLPTAAPYDTADWPSYGPPRSFKVTLAAGRRLTELVASAAARAAHLLEAVRAIHGLVATRLEWNAGLTAAVAARRAEHLARAAATTAVSATAAVPAATTATARAACRTVSGATARGVLQATARVELLLSGGPNELLAAVATGQGLVSE